MNTITMRTYAGEHIGTAADRAVKQSKELETDIAFEFNGINLLAKSNSNAADLCAQYDREVNAAAEEYHNSAKGIAERQRREQQIADRNVEIQRLCKSLPSVMAASTPAFLDGLMEWLRDFATAADDIAIEWDKCAPVPDGMKWVMRQFQDNGFTDNQHIGKGPEWFCTRDRLGEYIIGQAINCLKSGMPPHPITLTFIEKYFALP
jgi:hypothetical protein